MLQVTCDRATHRVVRALITQRAGDTRFLRCGVVDGMTLGVEGLAFELFSRRATVGVTCLIVGKLRFVEHPMSVAPGGDVPTEIGHMGRDPTFRSREEVLRRAILAVGHHSRGMCAGVGLMRFPERHQPMRLVDITASDYFHGGDHFDTRIDDPMCLVEQFRVAARDGIQLNYIRLGKIVANAFI